MSENVNQNVSKLFSTIFLKWFTDESSICITELVFIQHGSLRKYFPRCNVQHYIDGHCSEMTTAGIIYFESIIGLVQETIISMVH
jgi:hypothetical protein